MASATFTADTTTIMANPERGPYISFQDSDMMNNPTKINSDCILGFNGISLGTPPTNTGPLRLMHGYQVLPTGTISGTALTNMQTSFNNIRNNGMKVILTFLYSGAEPTLSVIQSQANQLAPVFAANRDVLFAMHAGFIGAFGEWHTSPSSLDTMSGKTSIKDILLSFVPIETPIQVNSTYPLQEVWFSITALQESEAFNGSDKSRIGSYGACLLTGQGDSSRYVTNGTVVGGYTVQQTRFTQRQYAKQQTNFVPHGGETCNNSQGAAAQMRTAGSGSIISVADGGTSPNGDPGGILAEGPAYHLSYLNRSFAMEFWNAWVVEGSTINTVNRLMGYRFQFDSITHADNVIRGSTLLLRVSMRNVGWSRIFSARRLGGRITSGASVAVGYSSAQLRQLPQQATASTTILIPIAIPANFPVGSATISLVMEDIYPSTATRRAYKIRPANAAGLWDDTNGWYSTSTSVNVLVNSADADFAARVAAPGVFRVRNWTTNADLGGGFGAEFGNLTQGANPAPVIDTVNKPFGNGSLRFNVTPILGGSMWWTNMSPDLSLQFGNSGETVYFQFPYMVSAEIPPTYAAKIFLFGTGDTTGVFQSSCSDLEIELNSQIFGQKFLAAYNACPGSCGANSVFPFFGAGNPGGQKFLVANQWMTIQCGVTLGPRETHNGSSWFAGSNVKIWIQYDVGPEILLYDWTGGVTAGSTPTSSPPNWGLCAGHTAPSTQRYGKLWLLPYNQELTGTNQQSGSIWYGPVIFSTQKIAARLA